jgi:predicted naringenin-chalcone synthase
MGAAEAWINRIETALPAHEVHGAYRRYALARLAGERERAAFARLDGRSGIARRWSVIEAAADGAAVDAAGAFRPGAFPDIGRRMETYARAAPDLALRALDRLLPPEDRAGVTHFILCSCTGFSAPGVDIELIARGGLRPDVERTIVGFMGCHGAINALKLARHVVRSEPAARVLVVSVELCTLHLKDTDDLGTLLSFGLWGDGAAAALVSAEPYGLRIDGFQTALELSGGGLMRWDIRQDAFDMVLSGHVPGAVRDMLAARREVFAGGADLWAVHPGGRAVLDAVEQALALPPEALEVSRGVLRDHGNMSSATVLFVLQAMMRDAAPGARGVAMAFGPGLTAETMRFVTAG